MKCLNCVHFNDKENSCEQGHNKDSCLFLVDIRRCPYNCEYCDIKEFCEIRESDIKDKQGYIDYYTRYEYD
jgi:hypothetical protein